MQNPAGSEYDRLFYPFLFDGGKASLEEILAQVRHSTREKCREVVELRRAMLPSRKEQLLAVSQAMAAAFRHGATLFAFGNGGSATDAQDLVADLLNPPLPHWRSLPALALTDDIAVITAVGNDIGFDTIFARQLIAFGKPGDIAVAISTSGNSSNLLLALEQAKRQGLLTVGFSGYDGGKMLHSSATDFCLFPPCDFLPRIQEAQATLYHTLIALVQALLQREPGVSPARTEV